MSEQTDADIVKTASELAYSLDFVELSDRLLDLSQRLATGEPAAPPEPERPPTLTHAPSPYDLASERAEAARKVARAIAIRNDVAAPVAAPEVPTPEQTT